MSRFWKPICNECSERVRVRTKARVVVWDMVCVRVVLHYLWLVIPWLSHVGECPLCKPIGNSESCIGASDVFCITYDNNTLNSKP